MRACLALAVLAGCVLVEAPVLPISCRQDVQLHGDAGFFLDSQGFSIRFGEDPPKACCVRRVEDACSCACVGGLPILYERPADTCTDITNRDDAGWCF